MTGAILPENADAIVMLEETKKADEGFSIEKPLEEKQNISFQGEDARKGEKLIEAGSFIHPGTIALLATFGYASVKVAKRPVASVLSTGPELLDVADTSMRVKMCS